MNMIDVCAPIYSEMSVLSESFHLCEFRRLPFLQNVEENQVYPPRVAVSLPNQESMFNNFKIALNRMIIQIIFYITNIFLNPKFISMMKVDCTFN